ISIEILVPSREYISLCLHHYILPLFCFLMLPPPPRSTLFPYTTLFRSRPLRVHAGERARRDVLLVLARVAEELRHRRQLFGGERSEEHTSELQSPCNLVCRLLLEKKKKKYTP